jgi:hypothetical protein
VDTEIGGERPSNSEQRIWGLYLLKLAISLLLVWIVLSHVEFQAIQMAARSVRIASALGSALFFSLGTLLAEAWRLQVAGSLVAERTLPFPKWFFMLLATRPWVYLLPAGIGAEGALWWKLRQEGWQHGGCAYVVLSTRILGVAFWALAIAAGLTFSSFGPASGGLLPAFLRGPLPWIALGLGLMGAVQLVKHLPRISGQVQFTRAGARTWLRLALATCAVGAVCCLSFLWAARSAGLQVSLGFSAGVLGLVYFGMALPVSLAGLGLQEAIVLLVGRKAGIADAQLLAICGVLHLQRGMLSALGLAAFLGKGKH